MNVEVKPSAAAYKLLIEKDVDVPMRDGARLKADVFRPDDGGKFPAILNLGPYQKDKLWVPPPQLGEKATPNMNWETVTPEWWVPKGYAAVRVDGRGSGKSPGQCEPWSLAEAVDFYDAVLTAIGFSRLVTRPGTIGFGKKYPEFWLNERRAMTPVDANSGAQQLYVSATPTASAVGFYLSRGCRLADPVHPVLFDLEPDDIHLVAELG